MVNITRYLYIIAAAAVLIGCAPKNREAEPKEAENVKVSEETDLSGKWEGTTTQYLMGRSSTSDLSVILSQSDKIVNGSVTITYPNNHTQTIQLAGFIQGNFISLEGEFKMGEGKGNIAGTIEGNKITGKLTAAPGYQGQDVELTKTN